MSDRRSRGLLRVAVARVAATLVLFAAAGCAPSAPKVTFGSGLTHVAAAPGVEAQEREMFRLLNRDRASEGLPPLKYDARLADVARSHSADMRDHGFFEHVSPTTGLPDDRLNAAGYLFRTARENLSEAPDVPQSQRGLMASPHHHENIMARDVSHVGIGIVRGGVREPTNLTVTQLFATPGRVETEAEAARTIERSITTARSQGGASALRRERKLDTVASQHLTEVDPESLEASLERAGNAISEDVAKAPPAGVRGVLVSAAMLTDSAGFMVPPLLLEARAKVFGFGLRQAKLADGRPVLLVLLVVGVE